MNIIRIALAAIALSFSFGLISCSEAPKADAPKADATEADATEAAAPEADAPKPQ